MDVSRKRFTSPPSRSSPTHTARRSLPETRYHRHSSGSESGSDDDESASQSSYQTQPRRHDPFQASTRSSTHPIRAMTTSPATVLFADDAPYNPPGAGAASHSPGSIIRSSSPPYVPFNPPVEHYDPDMSVLSTPETSPRVRAFSSPTSVHHPHHCSDTFSTHQ